MQAHPTKKMWNHLTSGFFLLVLASTLSITLTVAYAVQTPSPREQFITLATTGSDMTVRSIYPDRDPFIESGETLNWNVRIHNRMGETEYVAFRVKLLNATQFGPDDARHLPSPVRHIYEDRVVIADGASATMPLSISLGNVEVAGGKEIIRSLTINDREISGLDVSNADSKTFRFIIELWRYDSKFEDFVFSWPSGPESESTWNQIRIQVK